MTAVAVGVRPVLAVDSYHSNAELILACVQIGYLKAEWRTLDPTWGYGTFWKAWKPGRRPGRNKGRRRRGLNLSKRRIQRLLRKKVA